jgi:hypothetical protein
LPFPLRMPEAFKHQPEGSPIGFVCADFEKAFFI